MAERQQTPSDFKCMPLDKIIEAMTADLESTSGHYAHFGPSQTMPSNLDGYTRQHDRDYMATSMRNQTMHQNTASINSISQSMYMQDAPATYNANNTGEQIYFPPQTVNHLGINENNDLIGTIDVGGGNYINVIYGNASQIVAEQCGVTNMSYNNHQGIIDREYGLFNEQRIPVQHNNIPHHQNTNGKQLIDNLVGNWVPNQSGTYSPFGGSLNVTSTSSNATLDKKEQDALPKAVAEIQPQKKHRIVAEVKPMRPSYSAVLTKSPPPPSSLLNSPPTKLQSDAIAKKVSGKNSKNRNKPSSLKRQNSSGSDEHGSPKTQLPKKSLAANNTNLPRRWVSLDNLDVQSESNDINTFHRSEQFEKRKSTKIPKKNETLNNSKIQNGNVKSSVNTQKRPIQINNNLNSAMGINSLAMTEKMEKNQQANSKNNKDDKKLIKEKNIKRSHAEKAQQIKKGQKNRKRDNKESPIKDLFKNMNKYANRWSKIGLKIFYWLLHLISDVVSMSTNLVIQFIKCMWFHSILYMKYSWVYVASAFSKIRILNAMGKKVDNWFGNSRFAFWRHIKKSTKTEKEENTSWIQGGLETNIALPSTGEEAMKRLLACKGKDPYSILGVTPTCSDDDIKKYYKRQAFLVHPDKNSQPGAEEAFKILVHAFDIIGEPERRQAFDQTRQVEAAWGELSDLLSQLHRKMEQAANTIRCTNCGTRHKRIPTQRPCYAARFCAQCKIRHSAKEGDIWAESRVMGFFWHYYACMEGAVYDVTDWAACQAGNLKHLRANTHSVQYRIVLGHRPSTQTASNGGGSKKRQPADTTATDADLEDFLNTLYNHNKPGSSNNNNSNNNNNNNNNNSNNNTTTTSNNTTTSTTEQASTKNDNRRRKTRRK